ncbi:MAG: CbtB domain-containing protein [Gammaproteobacteria bacterium]
MLNPTTRYTVDSIPVVQESAIAISQWPAVLAFALGALVIFGVGFSHISIAHNAAHDTRHTMVFPCH